MRVRSSRGDRRSCCRLRIEEVADAEVERDCKATDGLSARAVLAGFHSPDGRRVHADAASKVCLSEAESFSGFLDPGSAELHAWIVRQADVPVKGYRR